MEPENSSSPTYVTHFDIGSNPDQTSSIQTPKNRLLIFRLISIALTIAIIIFIVLIINKLQ